MSRKAHLLLLVISSLLLFALIGQDGDLLLLAMPLLVYLTVGMILAPENINLTAQRILDKTSIVAEEDFEVRILIENQGNSLVNLKISDARFPSMRVVNGNAEKNLFITAGEKIELSYIANARRGLYSWKIIHAQAGDPFGLFEIEQEIPAKGELLVRPRPIQTRTMQFKPRVTSGTAGFIPARRAGSGTDFWGIREYRAGDSLRRINWRKATRHHRKMFTNEYEREEIANFGLILDARKLTNADAIEENLFEHSVSAAATLGQNILKNGNKLSLLVFGESIITAFPGYGKEHLNLLIRHLSRAKQGGNLSLSNIKYFPTSLFPSSSLLFIFSNIGSHDREAYARLCAFGYDLVVISPDPVDLAARTSTQTETNTLASRAAQIERVLQLNHLRKLGVRVINWQVNRPLEPLIRENLQKK